MRLMDRSAWFVHDAPSIIGGINFTEHAQPAAALKAWDGNVAAHFERFANQFLITSNARYIPLPPEIDTSHVVLRKDMRFGPDDPVLWPQLFTPTYPHLAAIPKAPTLPSDIAERGIMWWDPSPQDFVTGMSITRTLGKLSTSRQVELARPVRDLLARYDRYVEALPDHKPPTPLFPQLAKSLELSLERLQGFPATYVRMCLNVTTVQRQYLELSAMLSYFTVYKPRFECRSAESRYPDECIGVFTQDPEIAQLFSQAGLPYWFIRPFTAFAQENILRVVVPFSASDFLEYEPAANFAAIPTSDRLDDRLRAMTKSTQFTPWYTNPFIHDTHTAEQSSSGSNQIIATSPVVTPKWCSTGPSGVRRTLSDKLDTKFTNPYAAARSHKKAVKAATGPNPNAKPSRDKFVVLDSPEMPATIPPWSEALARVDRSRPPLCGVDQPQLYVFPEPALLASASDEARRRVYYHHYRLLRDALMFRLADPAVPHSLLTTQEWRDLLLGKVVTQGKKGSRLMQRTVRIEDLLAPAMNACGINALADFPVPAELTHPIVLHRVQELLWELAEMNWRYEFLGLDARASGIDRSDQCRKCFASTALIGLDFTDSRQGLAAVTVMDRLPYLLNMATLMLDWNVPCQRPQEIDEAITEKEWDRHKVRSLERRVATYYTQTFYDLFGRAAVIPMRLEHEFGC